MTTGFLIFSSTTNGGALFETQKIGLEIELLSSKSHTQHRFLKRRKLRLVLLQIANNQNFSCHRGQPFLGHARSTSMNSIELIKFRLSEIRWHFPFSDLSSVGSCSAVESNLALITCEVCVIDQATKQVVQKFMVHVTMHSVFQ